MDNGNLKLAIQKKGRLTDESLKLLKLCGLDIDNSGSRLFVTAKNFGLDLLFLRDDDIPEYVQDGVADLGIVGENVVVEKEKNVEFLKYLGFSKCRLLIGIPEEEELTDVRQLNGKRIATSYPVILNNYLSKYKINAEIINISGSVEISPSIGISDYICDIVSTGNTLKMHKLKKSFEVFNSQAVLIKNKETNGRKKGVLDDLLHRIDSVLAGKNSKYIMMNIPKNSINKIVDILPSLKSPTVLPLADETMVAVHAVIHANQFWKINKDLTNAGASGIIMLPIDNLIP